MSVIDDKVRDAFSKYPKRSYPKGQILVFAQEEPEYIFYLVSGRVRVYDVSYRGDEVVVNVFKPPAYFPMSWAINKSPNPYFYKTETRTELHIIPPDKAVEFLQSNPDVMLDLLSRIYRGVDGLLGRVVRLMSGSAKSRLIYELVIETRRFGQADSNKRYQLSVNEVDLAARTGLSRETVSREMKRLKEQDIVSVQGKVITVNDPKKLQAALIAEI